MRRVSAIAVAMLMSSQLLACAVVQEKSWVGENVLPTRTSKQISFGTRDNDKQTNYSYSGHWPLKVREDKDGWIRFHDGNHEGWARKADFIPAKDAYEYFTRRIEANPNDQFAFNMRGGYWQEKKEYDKAIEDYDRCLRLNPSNATAYNNRAYAWYDKNDYDKAIADFNEAIRLNPRSVTALLGRGLAWKNKKDYDKALHDYDEAVHIDPHYSKLYYSRGIVWLLKKEYDKAIADFNETLKIDPKYTSAHYERGLAWMEKKEYDKAIEDFTATVRLDHKNSPAFYRRGLAWRMKRDYDKALQDYDEAIRLNPRYVFALQSRGLVLRFTKQYEKAIKDYNEAIRLDPKNPTSYSQLAWLLATCPDEAFRNGSRAVTLAKKACALTDDDPIHLDVLAAAHAESGQFNEAVQCEKQALQSARFEKQSGINARKRLQLYEEKKPYRDR